MIAFKCLQGRPRCVRVWRAVGGRRVALEEAGSLGDGGKHIEASAAGEDSQLLFTTRCLVRVLELFVVLRHGYPLPRFS